MFLLNQLILQELFWVSQSPRNVILVI